MYWGSDTCRRASMRCCRAFLRPPPLHTPDRCTIGRASRANIMYTPWWRVALGVITEIFAQKSTIGWLGSLKGTSSTFVHLSKFKVINCGGWQDRQGPTERHSPLGRGPKISGPLEAVLLAERRRYLCGTPGTAVTRHDFDLSTCLKSTHAVSLPFVIVRSLTATDDGSAYSTGPPVEPIPRYRCRKGHRSTLTARSRPPAAQ